MIQIHLLVQTLNFEINSMLQIDEMLASLLYHVSALRSTSNHIALSYLKIKGPCWYSLYFSTEKNYSIN